MLLSFPLMVFLWRWWNGLEKKYFIRFHFRVNRNSNYKFSAHCFNTILHTNRSVKVILVSRRWIDECLFKDNYNSKETFLSQFQFAFYNSFMTWFSFFWEVLYFSCNYASYIMRPTCNRMINTSHKCSRRWLLQMNK